MAGQSRECWERARDGYASAIASLTSLTPLAFARLLDDVHALATLARRLTPEIDSTLAMGHDLVRAANEAIPKLDELNRHFDGAVPAASELNGNLAAAVPVAEQLNRHLADALPLLTALEPSVREGLELIGPLRGEIERLGRVLDRLQLADRIGPIVERFSGRRGTGTEPE
jgi:hypothetical protein